MKDIKITPEIVEEHGLTPDEYELIKKLLGGREPNYVELGIFSVMWSEHCSYKNSIAVIKKFPKITKNLLALPGEENAGIVDIGGGKGIAFKMESHNHPSAVEPYEGAATGVGGIMRDVFTVGARPIACLDSLRFGKLTDDRTKYLFKGVIEGIADYGNCFGVPTVGGEIYFNDSYKGNPLVNVMAVGVMDKKDLVRAVAKGEGNSVIYIGHTTGRDGIHGATFASVDITEETAEQRSSVQVGDPFTEKVLLEATLELGKTDAVIGIQDMGAAGLTSSSSEMSFAGNSGIEFDVALVPKREEGMTPYEIMLSESQERMLVIAKKGQEEEVHKVCRKWGLNSVQIGKVTSDGILRVLENGEVVAEIPSRALALGGDVPQYIRETKRPAYMDVEHSFDVEALDEVGEHNEFLLEMLKNPTIASKKSVFEQYDHMIRTNTVVLPGHDAAVLRIKGTDKHVAVTADCNSNFVYLDPYEGGKAAVMEAARNLAASGAKPLGITNCLNFGNPYNPEIYYQFENAGRGIGDACKALDIPITGGNVSFYNENPDGAVNPTPTIGMVGLIEGKDYSDSSKNLNIFLKDADELVFLVGKTEKEMGGSQYLYGRTGKVTGKPPQINTEKEAALYDAFIRLTDKNIITSAHDCAEGGLAVTLAEMVMSSEFGLDFNIEMPFRKDFFLYSESSGRLVFTAKEEHKDEIMEALKDFDCSIIGKTIEENILRVSNLIELNKSEMKDAYDHALEGYFR